MFRFAPMLWVAPALEFTTMGGGLGCLNGQVGGGHELNHEAKIVRNFVCGLQKFANSHEIWKQFMVDSDPCLKGAQYS